MGPKIVHLEAEIVVGHREITSEKEWCLMYSNQEETPGVPWWSSG